MPTSAAARRTRGLSRSRSVDEAALESGELIVAASAPEQVLALQGALGNVAVSRVLARQGYPDDEEELQLDAGVPLPGGTPDAGAAADAPLRADPVAGVVGGPGASPPPGMAPMAPGEGGGTARATAEMPPESVRIPPDRPGRPTPPVAGGPPIGGPEARAPDPAPPRPAAPSAGSPSSGVDWDSVWTGLSDNSGNIARTIFEAGRLVPSVGLWSGLAADGINAYQDITSVPDVEGAWLMEGALVIRSLVNATNNAIGAILYVDQLIQDGLAGSVIGAEFVPITVVVNEIGELGKVYVDGAQFFIDSTIAMGSYAMTELAMRRDPAEAAAWQALLDGYQANVWTDIFTTANDLLGLATGGASQSGAIDQGTKAFRQIAATWKWAWPAARSFLISLWNVWGSKVTADEAPAASLARVAHDHVLARQGGVGGALEGFAWDVVIAELQGLRRCYDIGDAVIGAGADAMSAAIEDANRTVTEMLGGQEPFALVQELSVELMGDLRGKLSGLAEMEALTRSGSENAELLREQIGSLTSLLDSLEVPDVEIPEIDVGEGMAADAAEAVLGLGADVANAGLVLIVDQVRGAVDEGKAALREPLDAILAEVDSIGEFISLMGQAASAQIMAIEAFVAEMETKLAACEGVPDVIEMLVNEALGIIGIDAEFSFEDIRDSWHELGPMIDDAIAYAEARASGARAELPEEPASGAGPLAAAAPAEA